MENSFGALNTVVLCRRIKLNWITKVILFVTFAGERKRNDRERQKNPWTDWRNYDCSGSSSVRIYIWWLEVGGILFSDTTNDFNYY